MKTGEKRLYVENTLSQQLILFWLAGNTIFTLLTINNMEVTVRLGFFVMLNIGLSLLAFLIAVRQKMYLTQYAYIGFVFGLFQLMRLMWMPPEIVGSMRLFLQVILIATGVAALVASYICLQRSREREKFLDQNKFSFASAKE